MNIHVKDDIAQQFDPVLRGKNTPQHKLTGFKGFRKKHVLYHQLWFVFKVIRNDINQSIHSY